MDNQTNLTSEPQEINNILDVKKEKKVTMKNYIQYIENKQFLTNEKLSSQNKEIQTNSIKEATNISNLLTVEKKISKEKENNKNQKDIISVGDIIRIGYLIPEGNKERTQYYEGLIIAQKNRGLGKTVTLRRTVQNIGLEQVFFLNSPKIVSIIKKQSSKVRRAKLYFMRNLKGKATRLKIKL